VVKKKVGWRISSRLIERMRLKGQVSKKIVRDINLEEAELEEQRAYKEYMSFKKSNSEAARDTFLDGLVDEILKEGDQKKESILKMLKTWEFIRQMHKCVTWAFDDSHKGLIMFVVVDDENGNLVEKCSKEDVEKACMEENEKRFHQANDTPFMHSPLVEEFRYLGISPNVEAVMNGTYAPPPGMDKYAVKLLKQLQMPESVRNAPKVPAIIMMKQHVQGWKRAKEKTTSGLPLLHFGHMKAGICDPTIAEFEATMSHIPYATGYSPKHWQHVVDFELLKKEGVFCLETFQTIQLFEPDFNQNNKFLGKVTMDQVEKNKAIASEQYGSWKDFVAILHPSNKMLSPDLVQQYKTPAALCCNDAKLCYDQVVHSVASLCIQ
jgi:hypothetical protein